MQITKKSLFAVAYDFVGGPIRFLLPDNISERLHLTSLRQERLHIALPHIEGRLLDIGCGDNSLVTKYKNGIGVDIYDHGAGATIIPNNGTIPFKTEVFDTVTLLATLNYISTKERTIQETYRVLKNNGKVVVTMTNPFFGFLGHTIVRHDEDRTFKMPNYGLWKKEITHLFQNYGFEFVFHKRFLYFMNNLLIFKKT